MFRWIAADDELPEEGKYVLGIHNKGNWYDSKDQDHVNMVIVRLQKGISAQDREKMISGEIEDTDEGPYSCGWSSGYSKRSSITKACDEDGNNKRPYNWETFGPSSFFGQDITHWLELPSPPIEYIMGNNKHIPLEDKINKMAEQIGRRLDVGI